MTPHETLTVEVLEMLESVGVAATISQGRALADELLKRYPGLLTTAGRKPWERWAEEDYAELRRLYEEGQTIGQIMRRMDLTRGQVNGAVTRLNLKHRPEGER